MYKLKKTSHKIRLFLETIFYLAPIVTALFWIFFNTLSKAGMVQMPVPLHLIHLTAFTTLLAFGISLLPLGVAMFALHQLITVFKNYEKGQIFCLENAKCYRKLGFSFFAWVISGLITQPLLSLALTLANPPGEHLRMITLSFNGGDFATLLVGGIVIIISWVMMEGHKLAEEQAHTV